MKPLQKSVMHSQHPIIAHATPHGKSAIAVICLSGTYRIPHILVLSFFKSGPCLGRRPLLGFCPTLIEFLFPVSPDPLTAQHCIRGSVLAGGGWWHREALFFLFFCALGFLFPSFLLVTLLCVFGYYFTFFSATRSLSFFCPLFFLRPVLASCWFY